VGNCPHGEGVFWIFGRAETLMEQAANLAQAQHRLTGCRCTTGEVVIVAGQATPETEK
jgi:hypothetical protein